VPHSRAATGMSHPRLACWPAASLPGRRTPFRDVVSLPGLPLVHRLAPRPYV